MCKWTGCSVVRGGGEPWGAGLLFVLGLAWGGAADSEAQVRNLVPNPGFAGTGGVVAGATGTIPDQWRGFAVGGGAARVETLVVAVGELFPGSPASNAVQLSVSSYGTDQGFDHDPSRFPMLPGRAYQATFYVRTGNTNGSAQRFHFSFPLFDHRGYLGREPGGGAGLLATAGWTRVVGPLFADPEATFGHLAFRLQKDGGEDSIQIALPCVEGPPDRFVPPDANALALRRTWSTQDKLVGTSYFYWYRWPDSHFFDDAQHLDDALTDHFPDRESVSMESKAWHKKQAADAMEAGIDMFWPVYWAAPGNFDHPTYSLFVSGLTPLQEALDELKAEGKEPPRIGMFYDTSTLANSLRGASPPGGSADLTTTDGKDVFYRTIRSFFCVVHPRHWACIDGRPLVILYAAGFAANYDQSTFVYVNQQFASEFGGITPYIIRERSWNVVTDSDYRWGASLFGPFLDGIAAVGPGYDDRAVPGRWTPIRMRENGDYYRWSWLQVLRSAARMVHIETWSEMHEGTDICESVEYGRQYINLTSYYATHFKAGTVPNEQIDLAYPQPVDRPPDMTDGVEYADERVVRIRAEEGKIVREGIDDRAQADGSLTLVQRAEGSFLRTDPGYEHRYAYFALKDPYYYDQRRRVRVTLEYLDEGTGTVQLEYDSFDPAAPLNGAYAAVSAFNLPGSGLIRTHSVVLENARFSNRQNGGSDFRYYVGGATLFIRSVQVELLTLPAPILKVTALEPSPGSLLHWPPSAVRVAFSADVDPGSVTGQTIRLTRAGGDGRIGDANDVTVGASTIQTSGNQITFVPADSSWPSDFYQLHLVGRGAKPMANRAGNPLDGHFTGTLPSGDGTGARDFIAQFTLSYTRADLDRDGDADMADFARLQLCYAGPYVSVPAGCSDADINGDQHVDASDLRCLLSCLSGEGVPAVPGCETKP